jgi:hypothetical protein
MVERQRQQREMKEWAERKDSKMPELALSCLLLLLLQNSREKRRVQFCNKPPSSLPPTPTRKSLSFESSEACHSHFICRLHSLLPSLSSAIIIFFHFSFILCHPAILLPLYHSLALTFCHSLLHPSSAIRHLLPFAILFHPLLSSAFSHWLS